MNGEEPRPANFWVQSLVLFHVRIQPRFGDSGNEEDLGEDPFGRCEGKYIGGDYVIFLICICHVADTFWKEQKEIKMLGGRDGERANRPPTGDEWLLHRLQQVLGSFDGVQKLVWHLLFGCVFLFPY